MNKLAILMTVLAALIACSAAHDEEEIEQYSQLRIMPTDETETYYLTDENQIFHDYCIQSRDEIQKFIDETVNEASALVYDAFYESATDVGSEVLKNSINTISSIELVDKNAVEEATALVELNTLETNDEVMTKEEAKENLQENVESLSLLQTVSKSAKLVINSVIETVKLQVFSKLALLRAKYDGETLKEKISDACASLTYGLHRRLEGMLNSTKKSIKQSAAEQTPAQEALLEVISKARIDNVGCLSVGRITKIVRVCDILRLAGSTIYPMLGI